MRQKILRYVLLAIAALMVVLLGGYQLVKWQSGLNGNAIKQEMVRQAGAIAQSIPPSLVKELHFDESDLDNPVFQRIRKQMFDYGGFLPDVHIYSMKLVDSVLVFGPENLPEHHPASGKPGLPCKLSPEVLEAYQEGIPLTLGPLTDDHGSFVSALAPVFDTRTNQVLMMVGLDMAEDRFDSSRKLRVGFSLLVTGMAVLIVLTAAFSFIIRSILPSYRKKTYRHLETFLVAIFLLYVTMMVAAFTSMVEKKRHAEVFGERSASIHHEFVKELSMVSENLASVARFAESSELVTQGEFRKFVMPILEYTPVQSIGMIRKVPSGEIPQFEAMVRSHGQASFEVVDLGPGGVPIPSASRPVYFPVKHVLPAEGNEALPGLDLLHSTHTGPVIEKVIRDGLEHAAYLPVGPDSTYPEMFIRVFHPIPESLSGADVATGEERYEGLGGIVFGDVYLVKVLRNALFRQVFKEPHFMVAAIDLAAPEKQLAIGNHGPSDWDPARFSWVAGNQVASNPASFAPVFAFGKSFGLAITPSLVFLDALPATRFWVVVAFGSLLTMAFTLLVWFGINRKAFFEQLISERTRQLDESVAELKSALAWQETIFEGSLDAIFISDTNSRFVSVNLAAARLTGYTREELLGMRIPDLHEEIDLDAYRKYHKKLLGGEAVVSEAKVLRKDGKKVDVSFNNQRIIIDGNLYLHSSARDITSNKLAEQELIRAKERAEEGDRLKTAFLNNLSHEVRTPLNAIVGFSDVLDLEGSQSEKVSHLTGVIRNSSRQLLSIIDDIINISTAEAGLLRVYETRTDIKRVIQGVYDHHFMQASKKGLQLSSAFDLNQQECMAFTDKTKLQQILDNLVGNAIKFTDRGKVSFGCTRKGDFLEFFVSDRGPGIDPANRDLIFERFRQVETEHFRAKGGLGLGLSISKAFVDKMGGKIWYESVVGEGTRFFFTIPFNPAHPGPSEKTKLETIRMGEKKTILIAEDEENNFELLKEYLSGTGCSILHAWNGKEAVELMDQEPAIQLVLMDIKMPVMGGYEATRKIKEKSPKLPVIAITAYAQAGDREKAIKAGCDEYLSKPLTRQDFLSAIKPFLEKGEN